MFCTLDDNVYISYLLLTHVLIIHMEAIVLVEIVSEFKIAVIIIIISVFAIRLNTIHIFFSNICW